MREAGVVINNADEPIHWIVPDGRNVGHLPDDHGLWQVLWDNRYSLRGVAHTHPGGGLPSPSQVDLSTFAAIESALGRPLLWYIASKTHLAVCCRVADTYEVRPWTVTMPHWVERLRELSEYDR